QREEALNSQQMALCGRRPVIGSAAARERVAAMIDGILRIPRALATVAADAAKMRKEISRHKPPQGMLDVKLGPGGLVDLEFAVQGLQLTRHVGLHTRLEVALAELEAASLLPANIVAAIQFLW